LRALLRTTPPIESGAEPTTAGGHRADVRRFGLLLGFVVASLVVQGATQPGPVQEVVVSVLLGGSLVLAFAVGNVSPRMMALAVGVASLGVVVNVVWAATGHAEGGEIRLMNALVVALAPPAIGLGVIHNLRANRAVRVEAVMGVLALYILLGFLFAFVYGAIDRLGGNPFFANGAEASVANCIYYSFTTLATVGYGDLTARTDVGHTLSVSEALIGQIYLVTVVSLIVTNLRRRES
jgi:hypothetical protein